MMTATELAAMLNGREYGNEITTEEERQARECGLIAVFGASDDLMEFRGAINDEVGCWGGKVVGIDNQGILPDFEDVDHEYEDCKMYFQRDGKSKLVESISGDETADYTWIYKTQIPHATFDIMEDGEKYCRGIVFSIEELKR